MKKTKKLKPPRANVVVEREVEAVLAAIDRQGDPSRMSKENWRDFLSRLMDDLGMRLEAVVQELSDEED